MTGWPLFGSICACGLSCVFDAPSSPRRRSVFLLRIVSVELSASPSSRRWPVAGEIGAHGEALKDFTPFRRMAVDDCAAADIHAR